MSRDLTPKLLTPLSVSPRLAALLIFIHVGAMFSVALTPLSLPAKLALVSALAFSLLRALRQHALRKGKRAVVAIEIEAEGVRVHFGRAGALYPCEVVARFIHAHIVVLRLKHAGRYLNVVVPNDAVRDSQHRELRARLILGA